MASLKGFEELPHTADHAVRVWAETLVELFVEAARAFYSITVNESAGSTGHVINEFILEADDDVGLLVNFLNELNYLLFHGFIARIYHLKMGNNHLFARLEGGTTNQVKKEVKAVTYHDLAIKQQPEGYEVTVVFDV